MKITVDLQTILLILVIGYCIRYLVMLIYTKGFKAGAQYMEVKDTKQLMSTVETLKRTLSEPEVRGIEMLMSTLVGAQPPAAAKKNDDYKAEKKVGFADR